MEPTKPAVHRSLLSLVYQDKHKDTQIHTLISTTDSALVESLLCAAVKCVSAETAVRRN